MNKNTIYNFVKKYHISKTAFIIYCTAISLTLYFLFWTFLSPKGVISMIKLQDKLANVEITKQELINKMQNKKNKVDGMSLNSLDLDLLDEESRKVLGYVGKDEVVIYQENKEKNEPKN